MLGRTFLFLSFLKCWSKLHDLPMQHPVSWLLWDPTMVTMGFFFPSCRVLNLIHGRRNYLQMHLLVRWSQNTLQGLGCTCREILIIVWHFMLTPFFCFCLCCSFYLHQLWLKLSTFSMMKWTLIQPSTGWRGGPLVMSGSPFPNQRELVLMRSHMQRRPVMQWKLSQGN